MASRDPARPNLVLIVSDDQGPWALGCAGNPEIATPHLDALAAAGARLSRFYCASPVCSPARASLLTGAPPSRHGVHDWISAAHAGTDGADFLAGQPNLVDDLAAAGYRLGLSGKWHLGAHDRPRPGFVHWFAHRAGGGPYFGAPMFRDATPVTVDGYLTDALGADACGFLDAEAVRDEPFALFLNFTAPHSPWAGQHPAEYTDRYADCAFESCPQPPAHPWQATVDGRAWGGEADTRAALVGYFAAVTAMDAAVGRVLARLERAGLTGSTLVVFCSDNGFNCGHHGIWGKGNGTFPANMYDSSVQVPAIVSQPGRIAPGQVLDAMLCAYDLRPTLADHLGLALPSEVDGAELPGRSFAGLLAGRDDGAGRDRIVVFDEYGPTRMIRTARHKYVHRYPYGPHELYDLRDDPGEGVNLVDDPALAAVRDELAGTLDRWFARYADPALDGRGLPVTGAGQRRPLGDRALTAFAPPPFPVTGAHG